MKKKILLLDDKETIAKVVYFYLAGDYDFIYFENALKEAKGDYIFLADQDDVWKDDKVKNCLKCAGMNSYIM